MLVECEGNDPSAGRFTVIRPIHGHPNSKRKPLSEPASNSQWLFFASHHDCDESVLASHLIHNQFTPETAKRAASIYKANAEFAKLNPADNIPLNGRNGQTEDAKDVQQKAGTLPKSQVQPPANRMVAPPEELTVPIEDGRMAKIQFPLTEEGFSLLIESLKLWKNRLVKIVPKRTYPAQAIWQNNDSDQPVTIVGEMGEKNGERYFQSQDGTGIPASELRFGS